MANVVPTIAIAISDEQITTPSTDLVKVLILDIKLAAGSGVVNTPTPIFSTGQAIEFAGEGSKLVQSVRALRTNSARVNLTVVAMTAAGTAATGTFTFGGSPTTANPILIQLEDRTLTIPVAIGDTPTVMGASAAAVLADGTNDDLHLTGGDAVGVFTLTARSLGEHGNEISIKNIQVPPGVTSVVVGMGDVIAGVGAPDVAAALAVLGAERYNYIGLPDTNATNTTAAIAFLDGRFAKDIALDGLAIAGKRDTVGNLATLMLGLDTNQLLVICEPHVPTNPWVQAAVYCARRATQTNPKVSLRDEDLTPILAPPSTLYLDPDDQNTIMSAGGATYHFPTGVPRINRSILPSKTNGLGQPSNAYRDAETRLTVSAMRQATILLLQPLIGKILVDDIGATEFGIDVAPFIIDAQTIREMLIDQFRNTFIPLGWTSDPDGYEATLVVTKTATDTVTYTSSPKVNGNLYQINGTLAFTQ